LSLAVHEFRTPASVVGGYLRMLQRDSDQPLSERQRKMIDEAEKSCARLVGLIAELSDIGKLDAGMVTLAAQPVDLFALLADVAGHVHEARERDVRLELRGADGQAPLAGDSTRLRSAFDAIFRAILREKAGPALVIADCRRERVDGRSSAVIVIAEDSRVQEAYARPRAAFDEKRGGLGLALPIARRVLEGHGGAIHAPAEAEGDTLARGSAIVIIPLTE
jgi:signal transduction histidine kinase